MSLELHERGTHAVWGDRRGSGDGYQGLRECAGSAQAPGARRPA